jgi:hypothetical protein
VFFGANYMAHVLAELAIDVLSLVLFAQLLRREGVTDWAPTTLVFAVALAAIGFSNYTEHYALPFVLAAITAVRTERYVMAGAAVAVATSFWLPAALVLLAIAFANRSRAPAAVGGFVTVTGALTVAYTSVAGSDAGVRADSLALRSHGRAAAATARRARATCRRLVRRRVYRRGGHASVVRALLHPGRSGGALRDRVVWCSDTRPRRDR